MCESNAYLIKDGKEELIMESVDLVRINGGTVLLKSIFGDETQVDAALRELNLTGHRILLEQS
jgi:predicted RNA-binding protein